MKWLRFAHQGREGFGVLDGDAVRVHTGSMFDAPQATGERMLLADLQWLPPVRPGKVAGLWNNFRAAGEKNAGAAPAEPLYFLKSPGSAVEVVVDGIGTLANVYG